MAKWCLGLLWIGYGGAALVFAYNKGKSSDLYTVIFLFLLIAVGSAGVQVNLIPFGADIVLYKTSEELSSYFYWNYWGRNLGGLAYALSLFCNASDQYLAWSAFIAAFALTLALSLIFLCGKWLTDDQAHQNPPKLIWNVLCYAFSTQRPTARSAFSFTGEVERPSRLDLAKLQHGGRFCAEEVEDVKTFLQLLLLLFSIGGALAVYTGITNVMAVQFQHMINSYFSTLKKGHCIPSPTSVWTFNVVTILIAIPIIDQCLYPCLRQYAPNMLKRFGISYILLIISAGILCTYETIGHHMHTPSKNSCMFKTEEGNNLNMSAWLTLVPITFVSLGEIFLKVTALEFMYAQSPHSMRAMMVGLFYWVDGVFSTFSALVLFGFYKSVDSNFQSSHQSCGFWYYCVFFVVGVVTLIVYVCVAKRYKNRVRGELVEGERYYRLQ